MGKRKSPKKRNTELSPLDVDHAAEMAAISDNSEVVEPDHYVTMSTVRELLKVQESMLKGLFESVVNSLSTRVDNVVKTVESLKASLEFTQKNVAELKPLQEQLVATNNDVKKLNTDLTSKALSLEYLENQSRRNNIRVSGIPETFKETWEEAEAKVKNAVQAKLGIELDIERAHRVDRKPRLGKFMVSNKPRTIVCKLRDWKQKDLVVRKARKEKPIDLFISEDLSPVTLQKRQSKIPELKAAKEAGKIAYFVLDRLIIRDKPSTDEY